MNWIFGIALFIVLVFMINNFLNLRRLKNLRLRFIENWGRPKDEEEYFNFDKIRLYFDNNKKKDSAYHIVSESASQDLDFDEVFKFLDRTSSKIGQQYLYYKLRTIGSQKELERFHSLVECMKKNEEISVESHLLLQRLNTPDSYFFEELINGIPIKKPKELWFVYLLTGIVILSITLSFISPLFLITIIPITVINSYFYYSNKNKIRYYLFAINQLITSQKVAKKLIKIKDIRDHFTDLNFLRDIDRLNFKTWFFSTSKRLEQDITLVFYMFWELIRILFNIEYLVFYQFIDEIVAKRKSIDALYQFLGEIDSAISTSSLYYGGLEICNPVFTNNKELDVEKVAHPLIAPCVTNSLNLKNKSLLLTGSNMSGKTTFIRTIALNSILAQTLHLCFAQKFHTPFFKVHTSIRMSDDLLDDTSYYLEEVLTIKELIEASKKSAPCLFVLDEIFKGTNTIERIAAGNSILSYLNQSNHIVLVSTHDTELTDFLVNENYDLYHFSETVENDELIFDHKLKKGKLKTKNAIRILELYDFPKEITEKAKLAIEKDL